MDILSTVMQLLTASAIIFAGWQLLLHSRQMHRDFEMLYVQRYWELMDKRSDEFLLNDDLMEMDRRVARGYLQLCEDEIDLRKLGRVTDNTWGFWAQCIAAQCTAPGYRDALSALPITLYPGLREHLGAGGAHDPLEHGWVWRKFHGL